MDRQNITMTVTDKMMMMMMKKMMMIMMKIRQKKSIGQKCSTYTSNPTFTTDKFTEFGSTGFDTTSVYIYIYRTYGHTMKLLKEVYAVKLTEDTNAFTWVANSLYYSGGGVPALS